MNREQRHIIKRQTIELKVEGGTPSQQFQAEISRIYHQRIVPLINEYCTALSAPDHIHRLDLLEIDLGSINIKRLEADLVAKIRATLYQALANQISQQEQAAKPQQPNLKARSQLELLTFFVQTGNLPWWAEATQPQLLENCLQYLIQTTPESLRRLMRKWGQENRLLHRLVFHYEDKPLSKLANLLAPSLNYSLAADPQILSLFLQKSPIAAGKSATQLKQHIWYIILQVLSLAGTQFSTPNSFYQTILTRIATELGTTYKALLIAVHQVLPETQALVHSKLKNILENLYLEQVDNIKTQPTTPKKSSSEARQNGLAFLPQHTNQSRHSINELDELALQQPVAALNHEFSKELFELTYEINETWNQEDNVTTTRDDIQLDLSFSEADELYINNAGLVILWPFLSHFFTHLDLLEDNKQFKNLAAMQRAVALLQYLAIENDNFPEYWLTLNKVLCGMAITDVYHLDSPFLESEMSECATLLKAVIVQAPILRDMSESGLRGTFLLRAGVLSTRNGAWLLRVERETYDIVLDHFPWNWVWVKLPWMELPLRVEW